jgi:hypothetical protein
MQAVLKAVLFQMQGVLKPVVLQLQADASSGQLLWQLPPPLPQLLLMQQQWWWLPCLVLGCCWHLWSAACRFCSSGACWTLCWC